MSKKSKKKTILVVTAGITDIWEPSKKELNKIRKVVTKSVEGTKVSAVLVIREGITVSKMKVR